MSRRSSVNLNKVKELSIHQTEILREVYHCVLDVNSPDDEPGEHDMIFIQALKFILSDETASTSRLEKADVSLNEFVNAIYNGADEDERVDAVSHIKDWF